MRWARSLGMPILMAPSARASEKVHTCSNSIGSEEETHQSWPLARHSSQLVNARNSGFQPVGHDPCWAGSPAHPPEQAGKLRMLSFPQSHPHRENSPICRHVITLCLSDSGNPPTSAHPGAQFLTTYAMDTSPAPSWHVIMLHLKLNKTL